MTRRTWFVAAGCAMAAGCGRRKRTGFPGYALIATAGDNSVTAVDLTSFRIVKTIAVGSPPTVIVPAAEGISYVLTPQTGSVHVIDNELRVASSHRLAAELSNIQLAAGRTRLLATAPGSRQLIEADPSDLRVQTRHKLSADPTAIDVSTAGMVAVASGPQGLIELFDLAGRRSEARLPGRVGQVRFRSDGKLLLIANHHDRALTVLAVPSLEIVAELPLAMQPRNLCFSADQGQLFVSGEGMDAIAIVFPYDMLEVEQTVLAGRDPGVMACSAVPNYLFVASASGSDICMMNVDTRKVIGIVEVGQRPAYIGITPDNRYALVLDEDSGDLAVIYIAGIRQNTLQTDRYKTAGALFTLLPVGNKPVHIAVVPKMA